MKKIIIVCLCLSLINCVSLVDKGDKLFEAGLYREAANFYQQALNKDNNNVNARIGLDRARVKIIDRELIEVRELRLSSSMSLATQKLEQIYRNERLWNIEPQGAITVTQAEETRYAKRWLLKEAQELSHSPYPDKFRWFRYRYQELIANGQLANTLNTYRDEVWNKGEKLCLSLAKDVKQQRFFLKSYTEKYCASWNNPVSLDIDTVDKTRFSRLAPSININQHIPKDHNQNDNLRGHISTLKEQFRKNIWFTPQAKNTLILQVDADFTYRGNSRRINRKVAYTTNETVVSTDTNGQETSKTVAVKHQHRYRVNLHTETLFMTVSYDSRILQQVVSRNIHKEESNTSESHNEEFPAANLYPKSADLMNINERVGSHLNTLNQEYLTALNQRWTTEYCERHISDISGENIIRCAALHPNNTYVNSWFSQKFGLNYQQMAELHGI